MPKTFYINLPLQSRRMQNESKHYFSKVWKWLDQRHLQHRPGDFYDDSCLLFPPLICYSLLNMKHIHTKCPDGVQGKEDIAQTQI